MHKSLAEQLFAEEEFIEAPDFMITHYVNEIVKFMTDDFLPQYLIQLNIPK